MPTKTEKEKRTVVELLDACVITGVTVVSNVPQLPCYEVGS